MLYTDLRVTIIEMYRKLLLIIKIIIINFIIYKGLKFAEADRLHLPQSCLSFQEKYKCQV